MTTTSTNTGPAPTTGHQPDAIVVDPDGTISTIALRPEGPDGVNLDETCLDALRAAIGCTRVACEKLVADVDMWLDDEGAFTSAVNLHSTWTLMAFLRPDERLVSPLFGTAVFAQVTDDGDTVGLTDEDARCILTLLDEAAQKFTLD